MNTKILNKLLHRQVQKHLADPGALPADVRKLLNEISDSYDQFETAICAQSDPAVIPLNHFQGLTPPFEKQQGSGSRQAGIPETGFTETALRATTSHSPDATEWKKAKKALLQANEELRTLFSKMRELFFSVDLEKYQLIQMSDACEDIYGRNVEEFRQNPNLWYELVVEKDKKIIDDNYPAMHAGQSFTQEYRVMHTDGQVRWLETKITPTMKDGKVVRVDGISSDITSRKEAEIALRDSEYKFRSLIENSVDAIMIVNERSEIKFASNSFYRIMGYTPEEVIGKPSFNQIFPDDLGLLKTHLENVLRSPGKALALTYRRVTKAGRVIWCEGIATNLFHKKAVDGVIVNFRDITDRLNVERALKDSEHKFRSLIQNSSDVISVLDEMGNFQFVSDSIFKITGFRPKELVGLGSANFVHAADFPELDRSFKKLIKHPEQTISVKYRRLKKDGSYIWLEGTAANLLNDPVIRGIVINLRNITEQKEYEDALKFSEHKFRTLIENSSEAIIVTNDELDITFASDSLYRVAGYKPEDIIGLPMLALAHPNEKEMITAFLEEVKNNSGLPRKLIYKTKKKDGTYIWCERVTLNLLHDPSIRGIVSNFRDITERIEYEEALKESNEELKKSNVELDKFVYSVSHDLRAPLASILGLIELSKTDTSPEEMLQHLAYIENSVHKLDSFINDILDYSKNARLDVANEKINFDTLLAELTDNLKFVGRDTADTKISIKVENGIPFYSDKHRISIILNNLLSNALRYANPAIAHPFVSIFVKLSAHQAEVVVEDNGIGIPAQFHNQIFDMFFRATNASTGSGLGLYIVKETLKKLEGTISFESTPGKGTKFIVTIPNSLS